MKSNSTYYFDEDDAVPIRRKTSSKKKTPSPITDTEIHFTPRNSRTSVSLKETKKNKEAESEKRDNTPPKTHKEEIKASTESDIIKVAEIPYNMNIGAVSSPVFSQVTETAKKKETAVKIVTAVTPEKEEKNNFEESYAPKKNKAFLISFLIYTIALLFISASALLYVRSLLLDYEAAQPENIVQAKIEELKTACKKGTIGEVVSLASIYESFSPSADEMVTFMYEFAESEITYKKTSDASDTENISFDILSDNYKMAELSLHSEGKVTKLVIFSMDKWKTEKFEVTGFTMDVTLPLSLTVKNGDEIIEGVPSDDGKTAVYSVSSLTMPEITFTDVLGNTKSYSDSGEYKFKEYIITIPSNYTLMGEDVIPLSAASLSDIDTYRYVSEYCQDMPKSATYNLCIMADEFSIKVLDNTGAEVDISELGNSFSIEEQTASDTIPENIVNAPDPLKLAKQWSLFMTDDLGGAKHGFYEMEKYLIADSYLREVAWKWATGVDITFTSPHTLAKDPFTTAEAANFISYGDNCFSCDIILEKPMYIKKANTVIDKIHSTFFFVYCDDTDNGKDDPHWAIADIQKIDE